MRTIQLDATVAEPTFIDRLNGSHHELALRVFMVIVLAALGRAPAAGDADLCVRMAGA